MTLTDQPVFVTGGHGFLGRAVCRVLADRGARVDAPTRHKCDLLNGAAAIVERRPAVVIHLAAACGGIGLNQREPGRLFRDNMLMGLHVVEAVRQVDAKVIVVGTTCSYPGDASTPIAEHDLWAGYPEPTNAPYGVAKRALGTMLDAYRRQYGLRAAYLLPANLYGPGDNFDARTSHVIPAMIRRFCQGGPVTLWGTGRASREFLYVDDAAEAVVRAAERVDHPAPINVGTGAEITIAALAAKVAAACGYDGPIAWDESKPDGQQRRCLDVRRAARLLGWSARVGLDEGLGRTVAWWRKNNLTRQPAF